MEDVEAAAVRQATATRTLEEAVHAARAAGAEWAGIARATGTTPRTAAERWPADA